LEEIKSQIESGLKVVDLDSHRERKKELSAKMLEPGFWDDSDKAAEISKEEADLGSRIESWEKVYEDVQGLLAMIEDVDAEHNPEETKEYEKMIENLEQQWKELSIETFLSGKFDQRNAILSVVAGAGGTDAQDFAEMIFRMYLRYAENRGWKTEILDVTEADEAGYKNATVRIEGPYVYGHLKFEHGVHRLVRLSPFNAGNTRETSFVMVDVLPELHFDDHVEINEEDLKIDVFRSSGPGGQSVNTTDSAVRITHVPTGIVVQSQNERSQHQNKEVAMRILQGKLQKLMEEKQAETLEDLRGHKHEVAWGNQIRSYVLHPYKMVKDHRTDFEVKDPDKVFDGDIHSFIERELEVMSNE